jgi:Fe-S-cluster containining protein
MRTCLECDGNCCYNNIGMRLRKSFAINHGLRLVPEENNIVEDDNAKAKDILMDSSYKDLLEAGIIFEKLEKDEPCQYLVNGKCSIQESKPKLCRTYWCHGKYFKRAPIAQLD